MGPTRKGYRAVTPASFADARKTAGLFAAPHPGSMAPEVFHAEKETPGPKKMKINASVYAKAAKVGKLELSTSDVLLLLPFYAHFPE